MADFAQAPYAFVNGPLTIKRQSSRMLFRARSSAVSVLSNVFAPKVRNQRELRRYIFSVSALALFVALSGDVVNNLVFFESWATCFRSWSITAAIVLTIALPIARSIGKAHMALFHSKREADRLARTDPLTGLANRRAFYEAISEFPGGVIALVIADIDRFKRINDHLGHAAGDEVLKAIARIMQDELSSLGALARVGGEEFALACANRKVAEIRERLDDFRKRLAAAPVLITEGAPVFVTFSAGVAAQPNGSFDVLYAAADKALYVAKMSGRNRIVDASEIHSLTGDPIPAEASEMRKRETRAS